MDKKAVVDFPIHDLLANRWSPYAFSEKMLSPDEIGSLMEAARWAPSCFNEQPWRFIVAQSDDGHAHEKMVSCLVEGNRVWASKAPVLILALAQTHFSRNNKPNGHALHDVGLAVNNLTVQASSMGLMVHQMAGILGDRIVEQYTVPEGIKPVTAIAVGFPGNTADLPESLAKREASPRSRKSRSELFFKDQWGQSF